MKSTRFFEPKTKAGLFQGNSIKAESAPVPQHDSVNHSRTNNNTLHCVVGQMCVVIMILLSFSCTASSLESVVFSLKSYWILFFLYVCIYKNVQL